MRHTLRYLILLCVAIASGLSSQVAAQNVQIPKVYFLSPNDSTILWKESPKKGLYQLFPRSGKEAPSGLKLYENYLTDEAVQNKVKEASSMDPGIIFNPPQQHQPAGIVIFPEHDIDPEMIIDLEPFTEKEEEQRVFLMPQHRFELKKPLSLKKRSPRQ